MRSGPIASKGEVISDDKGPAYKLACDVTGRMRVRAEQFERLREDLPVLIDGQRVPDCVADWLRVLGMR